MHTGMLWFDNSKDLLSVKVQKALKYYQEKFKKTPNLCLVHPSMLEEKDRNQKGVVLDNLTIRAYRPVLPGHIWIGIEDKE